MISASYEVLFFLWFIATLPLAFAAFVRLVGARKRDGSIAEALAAPVFIHALVTLAVSTAFFPTFVGIAELIIAVASSRARREYCAKRRFAAARKEAEQEACERAQAEAKQKDAERANNAKRARERADAKASENAARRWAREHDAYTDPAGNRFYVFDGARWPLPSEPSTGQTRQPSVTVLEAEREAARAEIARRQARERERAELAERQRKERSEPEPKAEPKAEDGDDWDPLIPRF